jgi:uncharacterized OB-fold protein
VSDAREIEVVDPTTEPFWRACRERRLIIQQCGACGRHQFYPRPFCLACESPDLAWVEARGEGRIYSMTTIRVPADPSIQPPYVVAIVELMEGPRLLTNIEGGPAVIGDPVVLAWREREPLPPLPIFGTARRRP